ncbi:MAG TPA: hypothetical protein VLS89_13460, partial [Candidatus Nanopelagicales bacterium]|nr:hypothetical protein [Candidatus Nanopelagicales bacterium]
LVERTLQALPERRPAEPSARPARGSGREVPRLLWGSLAAATALAALMAGFHHLGGGAAAEAVERIEERAVELPDDGHAWEVLDLWTHHHEDRPALVHVEVPEKVRVHLPDEDGGAMERHCEEDRCVHSFTRRHGDGVPVRVAVTHPGRYEIHVRHESREARVRERFILTAQRD